MLRLQIMANFAHSLSECIPATLLAVLIKAETLFDLAALLHCAAALQLNIWVQRVRFKPSLVPASRLWTIICVAPTKSHCVPCRGSWCCQTPSLDPVAEYSGFFNMTSVTPRGKEAACNLFLLSICPSAAISALSASVCLCLPLLLFTLSYRLAGLLTGLKSCSSASRSLNNYQH